MMKKAVVVALGLGLADAAVLMENEASSSLRGLPQGWKAVGPSPDEQGIELLFAVKQQNLSELEKELMAVSDPRSARYSKHLSNDEVHALVAPQDAHVAAVKAFLVQHGAVGVAVTPNADFIRATVTVAQAETMLQAKYVELSHSDVGQSVHRTMSYSLPDEVAAAVDFVSPTVHIPTPPKAPTAPTAAALKAMRVNSPAVLRELYSVGTVEGKTDGKMAVTAFLEQYYSEKDLEKFWDEFCDGITCGKGLPALVGDATTGRRAGVESMLDIETITGVAGNITSEFWGFSGRSPDNKENEPFMTWLAKVSSTSDADVPKLFSTSYGEDENAWSLAAATRLNAEFQKAGARGISLLYASGDEGANCKGGQYVPEGPGSSPYVTAVGGTTGSKGDSAAGLSSGGFSNYWPMPSYQTDAVKAYLATSELPDPKVGYNVTGRAYPDISAQATGFTVVANGHNNPGVAGTSCATPAVAGVIALLNDALIANGKPTLGFLNPWIYQNRDAWNDITKGSSGSGCSFSSGWPAAQGWDAVTGVGTANYAKLLATLGL